MGKKILWAVLSVLFSMLFVFTACSPEQNGGENPGEQPDADGSEGDDERFPKQNKPDVPLAHAEDVVKAELFLPSADQERVGVKQKDDGKQRDDPAAQREHALNGVPAHLELQRVADGEEHDDVKHHHHAGAGEDEREKHPFILSDAEGGQLRIKGETCLHWFIPPVSISVRVSEIF